MPGSPATTRSDRPGRRRSERCRCDASRGASGSSAIHIRRDVVDGGLREGALTLRALVAPPTMDAGGRVDAREGVLEMEMPAAFEDVRLVELGERRRDLESMIHGGLHEGFDVAEELAAAVREGIPLQGAERDGRVAVERAPDRGFRQEEQVSPG